VQVTLPVCATITQISSGFVKDGKQQVHIAQVLKQDVAVGINYTCSG
jgi:hypothetical protein